MLPEKKAYINFSSLQELKNIYKRVFASPFLLYISEFSDLFSAAILKLKFNL